MNFEETPKHFKGRGRGEGGGRRKRCRGRPPVMYPIPYAREPSDREGLLELTTFEAKILELADIEGKKQEEIANILGVSQTSVWRYLKQTREKIAKAVLQHKKLNIKIIE